MVMAELNLTYDEAVEMAKKIIETWEKLGATDGDIFDAVMEVLNQPE